jgi:hypothetical protein
MARTRTSSPLRRRLESHLGRSGKWRAGTRPVPERHIPDCRVASPTELDATRFFNHLQLQAGITALLKLKGFLRDLQT